MRAALPFFSSILWVACLIAGQVAWASGGSEVGNGGGLAEKNLSYAYLELGSFIALCRHTPSCRLSDDEASILGKIAEALPSEQAKPGQLVFRSGKESPEFFKIDGVIRVAKTGDHVGDPIFLNSDLLYQPIAANEFRAMDVPLATSVLVHELGHHQGVKDHALLDRLGTKLQVLLLTDSERSEFWNGNAALVTFELNHVHKDEDKKTLHSVDEIVLENGTELYSLTQPIVAKMRCPTEAPSSGRQFAVRFYNAYQERGVQFDKRTRILRKPVRLWYILSCQTGQESDHGDMALWLMFRKNPDASFTYLPDRLDVRQESCLVVKRVCK